MPSWFLIQSGPGSPAENMARDEALLESVSSHSRPVLRFYGWTEPAATFGYFQSYDEIASRTPLRPLIRRPTGGGLVPHDADWTYTLVFPPTDPWYQLKAADSYRQVHEWLRDAFQTLAVPTLLSPCCLPDGPGQCFVGAERFDLLFDGRKIAGAAQRRRKDGLLIQGSVQPSGTGATREQFELAACAVAAARWGVEWAPFPVSAAFERRVAELVASKYHPSCPCHTGRLVKASPA